MKCYTEYLFENGSTISVEIEEPGQASGVVRSARASITRLPKTMLESQAKMHTDNTPQTEVCQTHIVSVLSLVEFVLQAGDLTSGGFQRRDRAQLGTQGHKRVQRSRPEGYETEVEISYRVEGADPPMEVRGRIDGLYANEEPVIIEEIKTTTLSLHLVNEDHNHLHWAQ